MSDVIDRPVLEQEASRQEPPADHRLRHASEPASRADLNPFLPKRWQEHLKTYGNHLRTPYIGTTPYPRSSPLIARRDAWPPTGGPPGLRSRLHAQAASRSARCRVRHPAGARPLHLLAAESRIRRRDRSAPSTTGSSRSGAIREPRLKASILVGAGRYGGRDRRDRALRRRSAYRADQRLAARQRAARPPPLLADLRARRRAAACRSASMSAAMAAMRRPAAAGRPTTSRSTSPMRIPWRRR